jgi:hypothetical protein
MKARFYPLKEWGWIWIIGGILVAALSLAKTHTLTLASAIGAAFLISFGILAWPAIQRIGKGGDL